MKKKIERHQLATTIVDVFRLFKVSDAGRAITNSSDRVAAALGATIHAEAQTMLRKYIEEQRLAASELDAK